ncbi:ArsR/SmtB family transcription factor [Nocardioides massiliensis]|uniref:DNA-binding transcriptional ArsR family regulator n=1 Tax=Nocardioides massiliensis TaxID=1325935 RepID=A0ABT9NRC5_9ACTN|nr:metalloregulator ArsR/SmtB family transcription factor [Nocardioides massiliensis]MDP9822979.1 DNA-binding transcriptional ArsR family regulator [Nocardioides massiliensis]
MDAFAALADPVRRALLRRLSEGPARVADLAADHPISRPAVSRHLKVLVDAGLVVGEDRGRERHYVLVPEGLADVGALLKDLVPAPARFDNSVLDALDLEVRRTARDHRSAAPVTVAGESA